MKEEQECIQKLNNISWSGDLLLLHKKYIKNVRKLYKGKIVTKMPNSA